MTLIGKLAGADGLGVGVMNTGVGVGVMNTGVGDGVNDIVGVTLGVLLGVGVGDAPTYALVLYTIGAET